MNNIMGCQCVKSLRCTDCNLIHLKLDPASSLTSLNSFVNNNQTSVTELIDAYSDPEEVEIKCKRCNATRHYEAEDKHKHIVKHELMTLKKYVMFILPRFEGVLNTEKSQTIIEANKSIKINKNKYNLIGQLLHHGRSKVGGHYTVEIKTMNAVWHLSDSMEPQKMRDSFTSQSNENLSSNIFIFFSPL